MSLRKLATVVFPQNEEKKDEDFPPSPDEEEGLEAVWDTTTNKKNSTSVRLLEPYTLGNETPSPSRWKKSPRANKKPPSPKKASPSPKKNLNTTTETADDSFQANSPSPSRTKQEPKQKGPFLFGKKNKTKPTTKRNQKKPSPRGDATFYVASDDNQVVKRGNNDKYKLKPVERFVAQIVVKDGAGEPLMSDNDNDDDSDVISIKSIDEQTSKQLEEADDISITSLEGVKKYGKNIDNPCMLVSPKDVLRGRRVTRQGMEQHQGQDNRARPPVFRSPEFVAAPQGPPAILVQHSWDSLLSNEDARPEDAPTIEFGDEELDSMSMKEAPPPPLSITVDKASGSPRRQKNSKPTRQPKQQPSKTSKQKEMKKNTSKRRGFFNNRKQSGKENNPNKNGKGQSKNQSKAPQSKTNAGKKDSPAKQTKKQYPSAVVTTSIPMENRVEETTSLATRPVNEPRQANPPTRAVSRATAHALTALSVEHPLNDDEDDIEQRQHSGSKTPKLSSRDRVISRATADAMQKLSIEEHDIEEKEIDHSLTKKKAKPSFRKPVKMKHQTASEYLLEVVVLPPVIQREMEAENGRGIDQHVVNKRSSASVMRQSSIMSEETYRF